MVAEDYVHRIGRTGRAGETGQAVSLVSHDESGLLHDIQRAIKQEITITHFAGYAPSGPLRIDAGGPRPIMGNRGGQRPSRDGQRPGGSKPGAHRPHHAKPAGTGAKPGQRRNQGGASRGNGGGGSRSGWTSRA